MKSRRLLVVLLGVGLALLALSLPGVVLADDGCDRYVLGIDTSDSNDCSDETAPCHTIQYAIDQAADGDRICIASHSLAGPVVYTGTLSITKTVTLDGAHEGMCVDPSGLNCSIWTVTCDPALVTLDAEGTGRVVTIDGLGAATDVAPTLDCLTITGGDADELGGDIGGSNAGGGVYSRNAAPIIANSVITGNYGCDTCTSHYGIGGGIYMLHAPSTAVVRDSVIAYNVADNTAFGRGGGITLRNAYAQIVDNEILGNRAGLSAGDGGGIAVFDGAPIIRGNEVHDNLGGQAVSGYGGGIYVWSGSSVTVSGNDIHDNIAIFGAGDSGLVSAGGGLYVAGNPTILATIADNTLTSNTTSPLGPQAAAGGGIYLRGVVTPSTVTGNTLTDNIAGFNDDGRGGGIFAEDCTGLLATNTITANIATWSGDEGRGGGVHIEGGVVVFSGNTVAGNFGAYFPGFPSTAEGYGGGVSLLNSDSVVRSNEISGNIGTRAETWGLGGGVYAEGGTVDIGENDIRGNTATWHVSGFGGGIALTETTALIWDNEIVSNTATITEAGAGGGIYGGLGVYNVVGNLIQGNVASPVEIGTGGGVHFQFDTVTLEGNTVLDNVATPGGGFVSAGGGVRIAVVDAFTMTNNIVARNGPADQGDGVAILSSSGQMVHNTIVGNVGGDAVGVFVKGTSRVEMINNIVKDEKVGILNDSPGTSTVGAGVTLFESNGTDYLDVTSTDEVPAPASLLVNYHLGPTSNAIDNAKGLGWVVGDIDGEIRPAGSGPDVGADEVTCLARISDDTEFPTVQQAVDAAGLTGKVRIAEGICYENVSIGKSVTLEGGWRRDFVVRLSDPATLTTIDGMGAGRVISMSAPTGQTIGPIIDGLTLTGGDATGLRGSPFTADIGGGIYGFRADATVRDCVLEGNVASTNYIGWGGGTGFYQSDAVLEHNVVKDNVASKTSNGYGGGIAIRSGQSSLTGNQVTGNTACEASGTGYGGGVWIAQATVPLTGNTIQGNLASAMGTGYGGGVHGFVAPQLTLSGDVISDNVASGGAVGYGGGVSTDRGQLVLDGVTLSSNEAASFGGGLYAIDSTAVAVAAAELVSNTAGMGGGFYLTEVQNPSVTDNTIAGNSAGYAGGGLVNAGAGLTFEDNLVADNRADGHAGGLWVASPGAAITRNEFVRNSADGDGGGLWLSGAANASLVNNIVGSNELGRTDSLGSGMYIDVGSADLVHTTWAQNTGGDGSGIHVGPQASVQLTNTILVSHTVGITVSASSSASLMTTLWGDGDWANVTDTGGVGSIATAADVVGAPVFADATGDDYRTLGGAGMDAAVDAGVSDDIDGHARPIGARSDIGAHEAWLRGYLPLVMKGH